MVRALLAGTKTQTRRLVTLPKGADLDGITKHECPPYEVFCSRPNQPTGEIRFGCPYGAPGDRLWVRETFAYPPGCEGARAEVAYRADLRPEDEREERSVRRIARGHVNPWRPSIFMPRWASRITLEITDVRVQRLQAVEPEDARAEGIVVSRCACEACHLAAPRICPADGGSYVEAFAELWNSINGKTSPWSSNPWCWCLSFKRVLP